MLVVAVWRPFDDGPAIKRQALGVWEEAIPSEPLRLTISSDPGGDGNAYWVASPGTPDTPLTAVLDGDEIRVLGDGAGDVVWVIVYDEGADTLIARRPATGETRILRRVSTPE